MPSIRAGLLLAVALQGCGRSELGVPGSTDSRYFAFVADSRELDHFELHVVDAFDTRLRIHRVSDTAASVEGYEPSWSPDGRWLTFHAGERFLADSQDGFAVRQLASNAGQCLWSSSSRWLACFLGDPTPALVVNDILGQEPEIIEPLLPPNNDGMAHWSPTHDRILFSREDVASQAREWFIAAPGEPARPLGIESTGLSAWKLEWSPDGTRIAMRVVASAKRELLYVVDVDQNPMSPRLLLDPGVDDSVFDYAWSGDSSLLVASSKLGMWSVAADGAPEADLFEEQAHAWHVCDHGRTLAYVADEADMPPRALYVRDLSGGQVSSARWIGGTRYVESLDASYETDALFIEMWDEPDRLYYARSTGGPPVALHELNKPRATQYDVPLSRDGQRVLLALGHDDLELRVVKLSQNPTTQMTLATSGVFLDAKWGTSSLFSFVHSEAYDSWGSIFVAGPEEDSLRRVYTPHSNLRSVRWTGWQP